MGTALLLYWFLGIIYLHLSSARESSSHTDATEENDLPEAEINKAAFHLPAIDFLQGKPQSCFEVQGRAAREEGDKTEGKRGFEIKLISVI